MHQRILTAVDWTAGTEAVLDQTRRLAWPTGAMVHVLHVHPMSPPTPLSTLGHLAVQTLITEPAAGRERCDAPDGRRRGGRAPRARCPGGRPPAGGHAREHAASRTGPGDTPRGSSSSVLGSRLHGRPRTLFGPSVIEQPARHAKCPILIAPDDARAIRKSGRPRRPPPGVIVRQITGRRFPQALTVAPVIGFDDEALPDRSFPEHGAAGSLE